MAPIAPFNDQRFDASDISYGCGEEGPSSAWRAAFPAGMSGVAFQVSARFGLAWAREAAAPAAEIGTGLQISTGL